MKKLLLTLPLIIIFLSNVFSQQPTPTVETDDDVVKISSNLIQIDVTVTGKDGKVITDLKPEEIEIFENGQRQEISNFTFVSSTVESASGKNDQNSAGIVLPSKIRPEQVRRTMALVVDDLTLSWESTHFVKRALKKFVEQQMQDGDLVAIIRTGAGIGALQQFTSDKRILLAAIEKIKWNPRGTGGIGAFAPIESGFPNSNETEGGDEDQPTDQLAELNQFRETIFATGTLGAINYVIRGMGELPGRKSVMLLSDGFSLFSTSANGFRDVNRVNDSLRRLVDLANRASVVIYTLDARGLVYTGLTAADDVSGLSTQQLHSVMSQRSDKLFDTQEGLVLLARQTGGLPILNNNDLSGGIRKVLDDQSYYLIGYQPDAETFDPAKRRFNKLEVKVRRPGANVRYRSGFFGISDEAIKRPTTQTAVQRLLSALSSPFAVSDINLSLNTLFKSDAAKTTSISSFVSIDVKDLKFVDTPQGKRAAFDIIAVNFGDNGSVADELTKVYTVNINNEVFEKFLSERFVYFFTFPVKKPGAYQMRVAIRDHNSEKLGSASQFVEVPNTAKKRLILSGVVLEGLSIDQWNREAQTGEKQATDPMADTALRLFKRNTVLRYGFEIYNAKQISGQPVKLLLSTKVFRDGKVIHESVPAPVDVSNQPNSSAINAVGALSLGGKLIPGEYVLQIVVTDQNAKAKYSAATQIVQFEVID